MRAKQIGINWHPGLSIYASDRFLKAVGEEYGWMGGLDDSGKLRCVLPFTVTRKALVRMIRFRVETMSIGEDLTVEEEKTFLNSVVEHFRTRGADMIIPATTNTIFRTYPDGAVTAPYGTFIIDLNQSEEVLWSRLHSKHRNVIRNAMKKGVQIRSGAGHVETAHALVRQTLKRSGLEFLAREPFDRLVKALGEHVKILIAEHQGTLQGCAVIPFSGHSAYYLYGGTSEKPVTGAMNLLQWEAIKLFQGLGVKRYDFVGVRINPKKGSKQDGLMLFKERFGGRLLQGYMWKYPFRPLKSLLYTLAVRVRRGGDIVDQERHKPANRLPFEMTPPSPAPCA